MPTISAHAPSTSPDLTTISDLELVAEVSRRAAQERHATAALIRSLIEFDRRRLYLAEGFASLYAYCTRALHYSEQAAFNRIEVARAAARWPQLLACIENGSLHLAGARLLAPHLTDENIELALHQSRYKSKRDIEEVAAALGRRSVLVAVAAEHYRLHLTISRQARDTLRQVQALMSHELPDGNEAVIFEQALTLLLQTLQKKRTAATEHPRPSNMPVPGSRHIPASVKRAVYKRDGGRCAFVGRQGRCPERHLLEYHHRVPYALGGQATADNIELRCRPHNVYEAEQDFGADAIAAARSERRRGATQPETSAAPPALAPGRVLDPEPPTSASGSTCASAMDETG